MRQEIIYGSIDRLCGSCSRTRNLDGSKVTWACCVCDLYVCQQCTLTVPGSKPVRYYDETFCSQDCKDKDERS